MSYYETREQRQIRELQRQFRATTQENAARRRAQADLDRRIRQNEAERRRTESRLQDSISRQQRQLQEQERENRRLGASIQALDQTDKRAYYSDFTAASGANHANSKRTGRSDI